MSSYHSVLDVVSYDSMKNQQNYLGKPATILQSIKLIQKPSYLCIIKYLSYNLYDVHFKESVKMYLLSAYTVVSCNILHCYPSIFTVVFQTSNKICEERRAKYPWEISQKNLLC